jgi:hypothetical protein
MPCYVEGPSIRDVEREAKKLSAMLCGIVAVLSRAGELDNVLNAVDWTESGVTWAEFQAWRADHAMKDANKASQVEEQMALAAVRRVATAKLSPDDLRVLGLSRDG